MSGTEKTPLLFTHYPLIMPELASNYSFPGFTELNRLARDYGARAAFAGHTHKHIYEDANRCVRYDHFQVPPSCSRLNASGFLLVTVNKPATDACGFSYKWIKYHSVYGTWNSEQGYPLLDLKLKGMTLTSSCSYFGQRITAGDSSQPVTIEGSGNIEFTANDRILLRPGFEIRNCGKFRANFRTCITSISD